MKKMFTLLFALLLSVTMFAQQARTPISQGQRSNQHATASFLDESSANRNNQVPSRAGAQVWCEDFETPPFPPTGWTLYGTPFESYDDWGHYGPYCFGYDFASPSYPTYGITTHAFTPTAGGVLSFWAMHDGVYNSSASYYTTYRIKVSTTDNAQGSFTTIKEYSNYAYTGINPNNVIFTPTQINSWYNMTADLNAYAGQQIYVAIEVYDHYGDDFITIDDICVIAPLTNDLQIQADALPYTKIPDFQANFLPFPNLTAKAINIGIETQTNISTSVIYNSTTMGPSNAIASLAAGATSAAMTIVPQIDFSTNLGTYNVVYTVSQTEEDEDISDNSATNSFEITENMYAIDEAVAPYNGVGYTGSASARLGNYFTIAKPAVLNQVELAFSVGSAAIQSNILLYTVNGLTIPSTPIFTQPYTRPAAGGLMIVDVPATELMQGTYFLCVQQAPAGDNIGVAYDGVPGRVCYGVGTGTGTALTQQTGFGSLAIRMIIEDAGYEMYKITTHVSPEGAGTVTGGGVYEVGEEVTLTAKAKLGFTFVEWSNGETDNPYIFEATEDIDITAIFDGEPPYCEDLIIGTGTTTTPDYPMAIWFNNSISQQIFLADEIGGAGWIASVSFQYINTFAANKPNQAFYLGYTNKDVFASTSDWVPLSNLTQVYAGSVLYSNENEWVTIEFDPPFEYNQTNCNLVLAVVNQSAYGGNSLACFNVSPAGGNRTLYWRSDGALNPSAPPAGTLASNRANTKFYICEGATPPACNPPTNLEVSYDFFCNEAKITWTLAEGSGCNTTYNVYRDDELLAEGIFGNSYTDLTYDPLVGHTWKVETVCDEGELQSKTEDAEACDNGCDKDIIGTGTLTSYYFPVGTFYSYSYTQQIYLADEIGEAGEITALAFRYIYTTETTKEPLTIYLGNTTQAIFTGTNLATYNWIPLSQMQEVFSGSVTFSNGWVVIEFDTPFEYIGCNLVVAVLNNNNGYNTSSNPTFQVTAAGANRTVYWNKDSSPAGDIDPDNMPTSGGTSALSVNRANIVFQICDRAPVVLEAPVATEATDLTCTSFVANWNAVEGATGYLLSVYSDDGIVITDYPVGDETSYELTDMAIGTTYYYTVKATYMCLTSEASNEIEADLIAYTITVTYGDNGTIIPEEDVIACGTDETFVIKPDKNYVVESLTVDGIPVIPPVKLYTFFDVSDSHTIHATFMPAPYEICFIIESEGNGTGTIEQIEDGITYPVEDDCVGVDENTFQQFLFYPAPNNVLAAVYINGVFNPLATTTGSFVIPNVQASYEIKVVFNLVDLTIVATAGENGTIDPIGTVLVPYGYDQYFVITPNVGYVVDQIFVDDNEPLPAANDYFFQDVVENHTIHVTFKKATVVIHMSWSDGGVLTPAGTSYTPTGTNSGDVYVLYNAIQMIEFVPEEGYKTVEVLVNGVSHPQDIPTGLHYFYYVTEEQWIHVNFEQMTYPIVSSFTGNGTISELGTVLVGHGEDKTYTFEPLVGHKIANVFVDGIDNYDAVNDGFYTFVNVIGSHTIKVVFEPMAYTISAYVQDGEGFVTPQGEIPVIYGDSKVFTFAPAYGWELEKVLIDGLENINAVLAGSYAFTNISANHTVDVFYTIKRFTMKSMTTGGGDIEPSGIMEVDYNTDVTYTITAEEGYEITSVLINGEDVGAVDTYTFSAIDADGTIEVIFTVITDPGDPGDPGDPTSITDYDGISVYSNTNVVYIVNENLVQINGVSIYDIYGRVVWQGEAPNKLNAISIDAANGIYVVRIATETAITTKKVSIIR